MHSLVRGRVPPFFMEDVRLSLSHVPPLTERELLVIDAILHEISPTQIARKYGLNMKTVSVHKRNAMKKLDVYSNSRLLRISRKIYDQ